jgi:putative ABC transport system permease protein
MELIYGVLEQGLIYGLVGLAIFLTLRITDFPDMGVNNSFTFGAALWFLVVKSGWHPILGTFAAFIGGAFIGYITAAFHLFFKIKNLLAGIITMIGLYSVNIRLMGGPNLPLINLPSLFSGTSIENLIILAIIVFSLTGLLILFLMSDFGLALRVAGNNPLLGETYGMNSKLAIGTLVAISNGLVALSGALLAQLQGFLDLNMGAGILIIGLIAIMLGEKISSSRKFSLLLLLSILGALLYKIAIVLALFSSDLGLKSSDLYLVTALMMVAILYKRS